MKINRLVVTFPILLMHLVVRSIEISELPYPYNTIETLLPFDGSGHFGSNQSKGLDLLIKKYDPRIVVEIGSYLGSSTRYIAKRLSADGIIYAVDHWLGNTEWHNQPNFAQAQSLFYLKFLSNIIHEELCHKIIPIKMPSIEAAYYFKDKADLIFIDGAHDYESVYKDLCAWYPHVAEGGVLCGDDFNWGASRPVKNAVERFARERNLTIKLIENWFWYYEKN